MTKANDSILVTPGSGATVATHTVDSKEHQVTLSADDAGHIHGTLPVYMMYQEPIVMSAAATDHWDLWNAGAAGEVLRIRKIFPIFVSTAAHAFTVPWRFDLHRTTAIGTGGTTHATEQAAPAAGTISINKMRPSDPALPSGITARARPTGGATAGTRLWPISYFLEEGSTANALPQLFSQFLNPVPELIHGQTLEIGNGAGLKMRQITATASTNCLVGWLVVFTVE